MYEYLDKLNPKQKEAAMHLNGPLLIVAGAGSGKTTVLINRLSYMVDKGINPENILLLTFTNNAADNMIERAGKLSNEECKKVTACTYHSFCAYIIRKYYKELGLSKDFDIIMPSEEEDAFMLMKAQLGFQHLKKFPPAKNLVALRSLCINKQYDLEETVEEYFGTTGVVIEILEVLKALDQYKKEKSLLNYDDLLLYMNRLLDIDEIRDELENQYKYIMVDEYQDTNALQESIIFKLTKKNKNLAVVGDDYQSIYAFRGSDIQNILEFPKRIGGCKKVIIDTNYRSTKEILKVANQIMKEHATFGFPKEMKDCGKSGKTVLMEVPYDTKEEAEKIMERIHKWIEKGNPLSEFAILERQSRTSAFLEAMLTKEGIPFEKLGGLKFLEHQCIIDILNYFRIISNPKDELAWFHVLDLLPGIGEVYAHRILADFGTDLFLCNEIYKKKSFYEEMRHLHGLWSGLYHSSNKLDFIRQFEIIRDRYFDLRERKIQNAHFEDESHREEAFQQLESDKETISTLKDMAEKYHSIPEFLDSLILDATPVLNKEDKLVISTIHSAKGMEWDLVILLDCMDGIMPSINDLDEDEGMESLRCLYVALTRAKKRLIIETPEIVNSCGCTFSNSSRFLNGCKRFGYIKEKTSNGFHKEKVYFDISYYEKENAKRLGAKWDSEKRCWYCYNIEECYTKLAKIYSRLYL